MQKVDELFRRVLDEHRELRALGGELSEFLERPRPEVGQNGAHTWAASLARMLVTFHDKVFRHFRDEEDSGCLDELVAAKPRAARAVDALREEHGRLLADLRSALDSAMMYSESKPPECLTLRRATRSILERFDRHEHEETELIQSLLCDDLGLGD